MVRRFFGRKKDDEESEEVDEVVTEAEPVEEVPEVKPVADAEFRDADPVEEDEEEKETVTEETPSGTIPYHDSFQDRLNYLLTDTEMASSIEAPDEFSLEFMAMGERFSVSKKPMGNVTIATGSAPDEDVFIRIGNDVVNELLSAVTFGDFSKIYLQYYKAPEPGKFVKIELRKAITSLNRRGYARVPTLKLLIGAARL